jgi:hypothetical protein
MNEVLDRRYASNWLVLKCSCQVHVPRFSGIFGNRDKSGGLYIPLEK